MYERIEAKQTAVEEVLRRLEAEGKVSSLVRWRYIRQALNALVLLREDFPWVEQAFGVKGGFESAHER
jgi:hypothetical protein